MELWRDTMRAAATMPGAVKHVTDRADVLERLKAAARPPASGGDAVVAIDICAAGVAITVVELIARSTATPFTVASHLVLEDVVVFDALRDLCIDARVLKVARRSSLFDATDAMLAGAALVHKRANAGFVNSTLSADLLSLFCGAPGSCVAAVRADAVLAGEGEHDANSVLTSAVGSARAAAVTIALAELLMQMVPKSFEGQHGEGRAGDQWWLARCGADCLIDVDDTPTLRNALEARATRLQQAALALPAARNATSSLAGRPRSSALPRRGDSTSALPASVPVDGSLPRRPHGAGSGVSGGTTGGGPQSSSGTGPAHAIHGVPTTALDAEPLHSLISRVAAAHHSRLGSWHGQRYAALPGPRAIGLSSGAATRRRRGAAVAHSGGLLPPDVDLW
jgi:hypothetical protein